MTVACAPVATLSALGDAEKTGRLACVIEIEVTTAVAVPSLESVTVPLAGTGTIVVSVSDAGSQVRSAIAPDCELPVQAAAATQGNIQMAKRELTISRPGSLPRDNAGRAGVER